MSRRKMPPCAICGKPAAALLTEFSICEKCHNATTAPDDICFECGEPLTDEDIAAGEVFCGRCRGNEEGEGERETMNDEG